jgi:signal transduction histidine kinase
MMSGNVNLKREYESALEKHAMLGNALSLYAGSLLERFEYDPSQERELLAAAVQNYSRYYTAERSGIGMTSRAEERLYSNMSPQWEASMDLSPPEDGKRSYVLRMMDERAVVFISGWVNIGQQRYRLDYAQDITGMLEAGKTLAWQIGGWLAAGLLLLAAGLYVIIKRALRPLAQLSEQAQAMGSGQYEQRISIVYEDEIGSLAGEFNQMAESVQARTRQLQETVREREALITSLAHELKTPLTSIMGYTSLLQDYAIEGPERERALQSIRAESKRLDDLSRKLLELFRLAGGQLLDLQPIDADAFFEQLQLIARFGLQQRRQSLDMESTVHQLCVDQELILVLLANLVDNASKASEPGSVLRLRIYKEAGRIVLAVSDPGSGIPAEHQGEVFQPFYMLDRARDRVKGGHGLGLSLCKAIAEAHGGWIRLESREGAGTTVYTVLPVRQVFAKR